MHGLTTILAGLAYLPVIIGLYLQIRKKYKPENQYRTQLTRFHIHMDQWGYLMWVLGGVVMWSQDWMAGLMFVSTRLVGLTLAEITFLQRRVFAPSWYQIVSHLTPRALVVVTISALVLFFADSDILGKAIRLLVALSFVARIWAIAREFHDVKKTEDGRRLWLYQLGKLGNYTATLIFSFWVTADAWRPLMIVLYAVITPCQALFVTQIARENRLFRKRNGVVA